MKVYQFNPRDAYPCNKLSRDRDGVLRGHVGGEPVSAVLLHNINGMQRVMIDDNKKNKWAFLMGAELEEVTNVPVNV